jgi:hypothetical protein
METISAAIVVRAILSSFLSLQFGLMVEVGGGISQFPILRETVLVKEHPDTLTSVYCLTHLLSTRKQFEKASILYQGVLSGYQLTPSWVLSVAQLVQLLSTSST